MEKVLPSKEVDERTWQEFLAGHPEIYTEAVMFRALFDDTRADWEGATPAPRMESLPEATLFRAAMARALFDDVRPEWEEHETATPAA